ncbi:MAG: hypothetical protein ACRC5G_08030 [Cetobacterium sp.]
MRNGHPSNSLMVVLNNFSSKLDKLICTLQTPEVPLGFSGSEVELIPNNNTGFYDQITYTWVNGVLQPLVTVPTTYPLVSNNSYDFEIGCSSVDGRTVIAYFEVNSSGVQPTILYEADGTTLVSDGSVLEKCTGITYDRELTEVCVDGFTWTKVRIFDTSTTTANLVSTFWIDNNETIQPAPVASLINNANCVPVLTQSISEAYADDLTTLLAGTSFVIYKPICCKIQVITTIGSFTLDEKIEVYSTADFNSSFFITQINVLSGNCPLEKIKVISNKTK